MQVLIGFAVRRGKNFEKRCMVSFQGRIASLGGLPRGQSIKGTLG
jgi:hypothetical protein